MQPSIQPSMFACDYDTFRSSELKSCSGSYYQISTLKLRKMIDINNLKFSDQVSFKLGIFYVCKPRRRLTALWRFINSVLLLSLLLLFLPSVDMFPREF